MSKALARSMSGTKLIEKRVAAGLTVHQLAAKARVSVQSLQKWERGAAKPQAAKARAVRDVLAQFEKPQDDVIDRDALAADVKACREAMQDLDAALRTLDNRLHLATGYFCKLAAHVDPYARQIWEQNGEDFLAMEAARNGSK